MLACHTLQFCLNIVDEASLGGHVEVSQNCRISTGLEAEKTITHVYHFILAEKSFQHANVSSLHSPCITTGNIKYNVHINQLLTCTMTLCMCN